MFQQFDSLGSHAYSTCTQVPESNLSCLVIVNDDTKILQTEYYL